MSANADRAVGPSGHDTPFSESTGQAAQLAVLADYEAMSEEYLGRVLDALGGVLSALARYPIDLPDRPAEETADELKRWQQHATLGFALNGSASQATLSVPDRDWDGVVRTVTERRREEHCYVEASINELREALWVSVETLHNVVKADHVTDDVMDTQMQRAKKALQRLQTGSIKSEVLGAVSSIQTAFAERRQEQQERYTRLASRLDKLGRQLEDARRESSSDALTGLGNRKLFDLMAPRAIQMFSLARQPVSLLMVDLDKLKMVNDMYGHQAGDQAIITLSKVMSRVFMRQSDVLCRIGGDEFAVILPNTDAKVAEALAHRLQDHLSRMPSPHPAMEFSMSASIGVAELELYEELDDWLKRADQALYSAKKSGHERVALADRQFKKSA